MESLEFTDGVYRTRRRRIPWYARGLPSLRFYFRFLARLFRSSFAAWRGRYDKPYWVADSTYVLRQLERVGVEFEISGINHFENLHEPCLFIGNHMSPLDSTVLPGLIRPFRPVTFVVKATLPEYPVFGRIVRSCDPVTVDRSNPRDDLKVMLKDGVARLNQGISLVIFPQATIRQNFDPADFNKIGVKLASRANVPIVPMALQTDAWSSPGIFNTDFGKIIPSRSVRIAFGPPVRVEGRGHPEHQAICQFIGQHLRVWQSTESRSCEIVE